MKKVYIVPELHEHSNTIIATLLAGSNTTSTNYDGTEQEKIGDGTIKDDNDNIGMAKGGSLFQDDFEE